MATEETAPLPSAELHIDQAIKLGSTAHARLIGSQRFVFLYQVIGLAVGLLIGSVLAGLVPAMAILAGLAVPEWLSILALPLLGGIVGWSTGLSLAQARHHAMFLTAIRARGTPEFTRAEYAIQREGLAIATGRGRTLIFWDAILQIIPSKDTWLLQVDTLTYLLPTAAFADGAAERAFLVQILERVRPEVKERSPEAIAASAG